MGGKKGNTLNKPILRDSVEKTIAYLRKTTERTHRPNMKNAKARPASEEDGGKKQVSTPFSSSPFRRTGNQSTDHIEGGRQKKTNNGRALQNGPKPRISNKEKTP